MFENRVMDIKIFNDNQTLIACSDDKTVKIIDFQDKNIN
jgi:WD40 repeat protein